VTGQRRIKASSMHKILTTLLAAAALAGAAAQPAAADNWYSSYGTSYVPGWDEYENWCSTPLSKGAQYANGAWGWFVDGCTTRRYTCPKWHTDGCRIQMISEFRASPYEGIYRTTQNARLRLWWDDGSYAGHVDRGCDRSYGTCSNYYLTWIYPGQSATVQCNGVYGFYVGYRSYSNLGATNRCSLQRPID
jgi:hypothetical protein